MAHSGSILVSLPIAIPGKLKKAAPKSKHLLTSCLHRTLLVCHYPKEVTWSNQSQCEKAQCDSIDQSGRMHSGALGWPPIALLWLIPHHPYYQHHKSPCSASQTLWLYGSPGLWFLEFNVLMSRLCDTEWKWKTIQLRKSTRAQEEAKEVMQRKALPRPQPQLHVWIR